MRDAEGLWHKHYAWVPVMPSDETSFFWLETVWRRKVWRNKWQYKSFRSDAEKATELAFQQLGPIRSEQENVQT